MSGMNLAVLDELNYSLFSRKDKCCVFISYKKEDQEAAKNIGTYLTDIVGVNIYLDTEDCILKEAVSEENDQKIVKSIHKGLSSSTHMICLVSDKTKLSWWVPYEIGYADKQNINVAVLKLKNVNDIPSYVKIKKVLVNIEDFLVYVSGLGEYGSIFEKEMLDRLNKSDNTILFNYID